MKVAIKYLCFCVCLFSSVTAEARGIANMNSGIVYEAMKDQYEELAQDMHEYDTIVRDIPVDWPCVIYPFGFTPEYFASLPNATPSTGVELVSMPYSNSLGDVLLSYKIFLPIAHHNLQPELIVTYNSERGIGNLGAGWNLDIPAVTLDTSCVQCPQSDYLLNGRRVVKGETRSNDTDEFYFYKKNYKEEIIRYIRNKNNFDEGTWKLTDTKGITYYYGKYDKDSTIIDVCRRNREIVEWKLCRIENPYGDYVNYVYDEGISGRDSIFVGNPGKKPHTCIILQKGNASSYYKKIVVLYAKEKPNGNDQWVEIRHYDFDIKNDYLEKIHSSGQKVRGDVAVGNIISYTHKFDYYDDRDSVKKYREYRNQYRNISVDSMIVDRTGLLKTVHTPLGGCYTIDYSYSELPDTLGAAKHSEQKEIIGDPIVEKYISLFTKKVDDSIKAAEMYKKQLVSYSRTKLDSMVKQGVDISLIPFDTLVQWHFNYTDRSKGKRVMTSLWVNDGIAADGLPSLNRYTYENPDCDSLGMFLGFGKVTTYNINTKTRDTLRKRVKSYDTSDIFRHSLIKKSEVYEGVDGEILQSVEYDWGIKMRGNLYSVGLREKKESIGNYTHVTTYEYCNIPDMGIDNVNKIHSIKYDDHSSMSFDYKTNGNGGMGLKSEIVLKEEDCLTAYHFTYSDQEPYHLISMKNGSKQTKFSYDKDGNISSIVSQVDGNGDSVVTRYLYDRRYNMFLERIDDNRGYRTELEDYDYPYGVATTIRDYNGFELRRSLDGYGRIDTILAPNEQDNNIPYSIIYLYRVKPQKEGSDLISENIYSDSLVLHISDQIYSGQIPDSVQLIILSSLMNKQIEEIDLEKSKVCLRDDMFMDPVFTVSYDTISIEECHCNDIANPIAAVTIRYNSIYNNINGSEGEKDSTLYDCIFVDGFAREMQDIKKVELTNIDQSLSAVENKGKRYVAYNAKTYDPFGRVKSICAPHIYGKSVVELEYDNLVYGEGDTIVSYDILDRLDTLSTNGYKIENNYQTIKGEGVLLTRVLNGNEIFGDTLEIVSYDYRNRISRKEVQCTNARKSDSDVRSFIQREKYYYDPLGRVTHFITPDDDKWYWYDSLGHIIREKSIRHGEIKYKYDRVGNLIEKQLADGNVIQYRYNRDLLTGISYKNPHHDVYLIYGDKNASYNRVGRLAMLVDETGVQEFYYGRHGEVTKIRRTLVVPNKSIETYTTQFKYDTWNRLAEVIYPDGEMVKYRYNNAGQIEHVWGEKSFLYNYVDRIGYDIRGNIVHFDYCNGDEVFRNQNAGRYMSNVLNQRISTKQLSHKQIIGHKSQIDTIDYHGFKLTKEYYLNNALKERNENINVVTGTQDFLYAVHYLAYDDSARLYIDKTTISQKNFIANGDSVFELRYKYHYTHPYLPNYKQERNNEVNGKYRTHYYGYNPNGEVISHRDLFVSNPEDSNLPVGGDNVNQYAYDGEGRILSKSENGYMTSYWYSGDGSLTYTITGEQGAVFVNATPAFQEKHPDQYYVCVNPYFERGSDSIWIKHIYVDGHPWVSKVEDNASYGAEACRVERAAINLSDTLSYQMLWENSYKSLSHRFTVLDSSAVGIAGYKPYPNPGTSMLRSANVDMGNDNYEYQQFYYHYDNNGNIILATDLEGKVYQTPIFFRSGDMIYNEKKGMWDCTDFNNRWDY